MQEPETAGPRASDIAGALALLSRLPVPDPAPARGAAAAWAYPLAGLAIGGLAALAGALALALDLTPALAAGFVLATLILATGAIHEDGLADSADGLWGGWDRDRRLQIMRDSRIGTYGVLALILSLGLRWSALAALFAAGHVVAPVLAAAALSRAPMSALMHALPAARAEGLSHAAGRASRQSALLAAGLALFVALLCLGLAGLAAALAAALAALGVAGVAQAKIGGQTGDILGAAQQVAEIAALAAMVALLN